MAKSDLFVIDTHALLWQLSGDRRRLSARALRALERAGVDIIVPAVVMAEAFVAIERRKVKLGLGDLLASMKDSIYRIVPLDTQVLQEMLKLPSSMELHDRMIAATALQYGAKVISRDRDMAGVVDVIW